MQIKHIAFVVTGLNSGGIENYLLRFLRYSKQKISATVYCKSGILGDLEKEYLEAGAKLIPFKMGMLSINDYRNFKKELQKNNYDSIVDFTGNFAAFPLLMAKAVGIPNRVVFYRGATNHFKEDVLRLTYNGFVNKLIPKVATAILSNSEAAFNFFFAKLWRDDKRFNVIYNGIDANAFLCSKENLRRELSIPNQAFVVGHVGRYDVAKNHKTMIKVAIEMCKQDTGLYFVFCGNKVKDNLEGIVKKNELTTQIKLLNYRKDIINVLNTLNCFYFPSLTEGQPNALIEAMTVGLPFVASNIDPIRETVPLQFHNQLVNALSVKDAQEKILEIQNDKNLGSSLNLALWAKSNFDPEILFEKFYEKL